MRVDVFARTDVEVSKRAAENRRLLVRGVLTALRWFARVGWHAVRLAALATLMFLEPIVSIALAGLCTCLVLTVLVLKVLAHRPDFPWLGMLLGAVACVRVRMAYLFLIDVLRR